MDKQRERQLKDEKMTVRDYITTAIMLVLIFLVFVVIGAPVGMTVIGNLFVFAVCSLVWGTIFLLLYTKVNKKGVVFLCGIVLAILQLMNFWAVAALIAIGAVLAEIVWRKLDRKKFTTMTLCFTIKIVFWYFGMTLPLIFLKDMYLAAAPSYADLYGAVSEFLVGPMFFIGLTATVAGCVIGSLVGKLLLKKHFIKAGIV